VYSFAVIDLEGVLQRCMAKKGPHTTTAGADTSDTGTVPAKPHTTSAASPTDQDEGGFGSQRRRKRGNSSEDRLDPSKKQVRLSGKEQQQDNRV
jgi:hypothetical protein